MDPIPQKEKRKSRSKDFEHTPSCPLVALLGENMFSGAKAVGLKPLQNDKNAKENVS